MVIGMFLYLAVTGVMSVIMSRFYPQIKKRNNHFLYDNMADDPTRWPMLFLYSKKDKVIHSEDIEDMISLRRKLGVRVEAVCWDDTDHVSHLRKHPEQYAKACTDFLIKCLQYVQDKEESFDKETLETSDDYLLSKKQ